MTDCIYDSAILLARPDQLRSSVCGQPMAPSKIHRHTLVYRCDQVACGQHIAEIDVVESGLVKEYRALPSPRMLGQAHRDIPGRHVQRTETGLGHHRRRLPRGGPIHRQITPVPAAAH